MYYFWFSILANFNSSVLSARAESCHSESNLFVVFKGCTIESLHAIKFTPRLSSLGNRYVQTSRSKRSQSVGSKCKDLTGLVLFFFPKK